MKVCILFKACINLQKCRPKKAFKDYTLRDVRLSNERLCEKKKKSKLKNKSEEFQRK
jgi:hypothetical protein